MMVEGYEADDLETIMPLGADAEQFISDNDFSEEEANSIRTQVAEHSKHNSPDSKLEMRMSDCTVRYQHGILSVIKD